MTPRKNNNNYYITLIGWFSVLFFFILNSSFNNIINVQSEFNSDQEILLNPIEFNRNDADITNSFSTIDMQSTPYFKKIFTGNGVSHMNINFVDLKLSGLKVGDEVGVFDGNYCVGSKIIGEQNMQENNLGIPSSANDTLESAPNGYIQGHKITLKTCRAGIVYSLLFQTINNSKDIFEVGDSMFALADFSRSNGQINQLNPEEIRIYPNPFDIDLKIEIYIPQQSLLKCEIFDENWKLVRILFNGEIFERINLIWDGKDSNQHLVQSGKYFCRINQTITEVTYNRPSSQ